MKIIYHCYGGAHSSVTAAALHLGYLPEDRIPDYNEIIHLPLFDKQSQNDHGKFFLMGIDNEGNEVYVVGCRGLGDTLDSIIRSIESISGINKNETVLVNTLSAVNFEMRVGGFTSRKLKIVFLGRPLVLYGTRKNYTKFLKLVKDTKENIRQKKNR